MLTEIAMQKGTLIRSAASVYLAAFLLRVVDGFVMVHQWPAAALSYLAWSKTQAQSELLPELSYAWLFVAVCSALAALGVLTGNRLSRLVFAGTFGGILVCELLITLFDQVPYLITPYQNLIGDVATLAAGIVIALSLLDRSR